jgi:hypothetical protein
MLLVCPQLAVAMPVSQCQAAVVATAPTPAPAASSSYLWHGVLTLILPAVMWLLGAEGTLPLHY